METGKSITNTEFIAALSKGIPIYTFSLKKMTAILPLWEQNPNVDYSNIVDNNKVFEFLSDVRKKRGLWNFEFERAQDITEILKAQLSNLFHDALVIKRKIEDSEISGLYAKISSKAVDILIKKDVAFEIRFFMQCMKDEIEKYTDLNNDYSFSIAYKSLITIENVSQFKKWAIHKVRELQNITVSIERLNSAINNFFADSDAAWDTISDVVASEKVFAYDEALSTNELIEVICSALGKKAHIWNIPRGLMNGFAKIGDVLHLPLNTQRMHKLTENYVVSNAKIKSALGMKQMPVRAKDGLRETIKSFAGKIN